MLRELKDVVSHRAGDVVTRPERATGRSTRVGRPPRRPSTRCGKRCWYTVEFVIAGLDALLELARIDFAPLYDRVRGQREIEPGELQPEDSVVTRGSGRYHAARQHGA